LQDGFCWARC